MWQLHESRLTREVGGLRRIVSESPLQIVVIELKSAGRGIEPVKASQANGSFPKFLGNAVAPSPCSAPVFQAPSQGVESSGGSGM